MAKWDARTVESAIAHQGLQMGQLIYTSFYQSGFVLLKSTDVPETVERVFVSQVVQASWDTYFPPKPGYRAVYLCNLFSTGLGALFGWLYHDGKDELKRADVPYFMAYYLPTPLEAKQLSQILTCLQKGPVEWIERLEKPPDRLLSISVDNIQDYSAARQGVELPPSQRVENYRALESQTLQNWFYAEPESIEQSPSLPESRSIAIPETTSIEYSPSLEEMHPSLDRPLPSKSLVSPRQFFGETTMNLDNLTTILTQLFTKPGIQGTALVSGEGQSIVSPIGIDENTAGILSGNMLNLLRNTQDELLWQDIEAVSVCSQEGYIILRSCGTDLYLLIKSEKVPMGLLEGEVSRAVKKLRTEIEVISNVDDELVLADLQAEPLRLEPSPNNTPESPSSSSLPLNPAVTYRGRRVSSE
ncbi:roadblock/LC7 domain-containing protein [Altericista sp. CCNU0014]|uniref:roadblock/LC7 domain-containing protein n=1 Tax=Altericista sp. CCNU0014 TaxID=3082949 RepID=UPI00384B089F